MFLTLYYEKLQRWEEAIEMADKLVQLDPGNSMFRRMLQSVRAKAGQSDDTIPDARDRWAQSARRGNRRTNIRYRQDAGGESPHSKRAEKKPSPHIKRRRGPCFKPGKRAVHSLLPSAGQALPNWEVSNASTRWKTRLVLCKTNRPQQNEEEPFDTIRFNRLCRSPERNSLCPEVNSCVRCGLEPNDSHPLANHLADQPCGPPCKRRLLIDSVVSDAAYTMICALLRAFPLRIFGERRLHRVFSNPYDGSCGPYSTCFTPR